MKKLRQLGSQQQIWQFTSTLEGSESRIYQTHVVVPSEIASALLALDAKRVVATVESNTASVEYQCGLIPRGKGKTVIMVNKEHRSTLSIDAGSAVRVELRKDESEYGLEMPEELAELFKQDEDGSRFFYALPEGKRRTLIYIVSSVKNSTRRIERAIAVVEHLKARSGKLDYKALYNDL
jgi:uncharacterized 2Fe-2S/4Fe-4S cluster protein (DUF4445 family)